MTFDRTDLVFAFSFCCDATTDDRPDLNTLAVFLATTEQAIQYHAGIWHHPMIALGDQPTDFACIVNESATQPQLDCDEVEV